MGRLPTRPHTTSLVRFVGRCGGCSHLAVRPGCSRRWSMSAAIRPGPVLWYRTRPKGSVGAPRHTDWPPAAHLSARMFDSARDGMPGACWKGDGGLRVYGRTVAANCHAPTFPPNPERHELPAWRRQLPGLQRWEATRSGRTGGCEAEWVGWGWTHRAAATGGREAARAWVDSPRAFPTVKWWVAGTGGRGTPGRRSARSPHRQGAPCGQSPAALFAAPLLTPHFDALTYWLY